MTDKPIVWGKPPSDNISLDECEWYHAMEIPGIEGLTGSQPNTRDASFDCREDIGNILGNLDYKGKKVLNLGSITGYLSFEAERRGGDVSREGVQRDLLPLIEGTVVTTKYGTIETNHILFIASGAFHQSKPSDLLPELQGRLPVRVRLNALTKNDFIRILKETDNSLTKQYKSLFATENMQLQFEDDALEEIANLTEQINTEVENIGARRLQTMFEKILERISFEANLSDNKIEVVNKAWVNDAVKSEIKPTDEKKFIL